MPAERVDEKAILDELHQLPESRWAEVIRHIRELRDDEARGGGQKTLRGSDLIGSDLIGIWADRPECEDSQAFARQLRNTAENQFWSRNAAGQ